MNDQDKTEEELIKELQELQQKKNSLRALYEKNLIDRKQFEQQEFHAIRIKFYKDL